MKVLSYPSARGVSALIALDMPEEVLQQMELFECFAGDEIPCVGEQLCCGVGQVPALKAHLRGKWVGGQEWRPGNKKRSELIDDYR